MNWLDLLQTTDERRLKNFEPMYARITAGIRDAIQSGQLAENTRLPTNRELASILKIDRSTVSRAYSELMQSGLIDSHVGRGTFVRPLKQRQTNYQQPPLNLINTQHLDSDESRLSFTNNRGSEFNWFEKFSESSRTALDLINRQPVETLQSDLISFAGGLPTEEFYPNDQFKRIVTELLQTEYAAEMFGYSAAEGSPYFREQVKKHLATSGIECGDEQLLIVSGSQQGIDLVTNVFVDPGDFVVLEDPSYFWAICNFRARQARCLPTAVDADGMRLDILESHLARQQVKLIYVMPNFQNPTGTSMSHAKRVALIELAKKYRVPILEDNFVGDLVYGSELPPSLRSLPGGKDVVIHQGTFSKALCPGLRLGWLVAPPEVAARLLLAKRTSDLSTNSIAQIILARYLEEGLYSKHLEHVRACYRERRDTMLKSLSHHFERNVSDRLTWSKPDGGLFIWARLSNGLSARDLLTFAQMQGVSFSPGDMFFLKGDNAEYLRLCFIQSEEAAIEEGIDRLARAVRNYTKTVARSSPTGASGGARVRNNVLI